MKLQNIYVKILYVIWQMEVKLYYKISLIDLIYVTFGLLIIILIQPYSYHVN